LVKSSNNFFAKFFLLVASTIIGLSIAEMYYRYTELKVPEDTLRVFQSIYPDSPKQIYAFKPNYNERHKTIDFDVTVETDERGFRLPAPNKIDDIDVLVMGDSFTFGWGLEGEERYGYLFGQQSGLKTLVASYNNGITTPHYYKYFLLNENFKPSHIIVGLFLGNDIYLDINETDIFNDPFDIALPYRWVDRHGRLRSKGVLKYEFLEYLNVKSFFFKKLLNYILLRKQAAFFLIKDHVRWSSINTKELDMGNPTPQSELALDYLVRLEKECKARNSECKLHTLIIPQRQFVRAVRPDEPEHFKAMKERIKNGKPTSLTYILDGCEKRKLNCLNPLADLLKAEGEGTPMYFEYDGHWSPAGNAEAADFLCRNIKNITCKPVNQLSKN
jgi:hypothetical protein